VGKTALITAFIWLGASSWTAFQAAPPQSPASTPVVASSSDVSDPNTTIKRYCTGCHNERLKTAGLALDGLDPAKVPEHADVWEKVVRKVRVGMMPPSGASRPDDRTRRDLVTSLETMLDRASIAKPNPGRPPVHRLNRAEYANAIHDLLALDVNPVVLLPPDESGDGFDNIADLLGTSPLLLERYLTAAGTISELAIGDPRMVPGNETFIVRQDASQDRHVEGLPVGTVGGGLGRVTLPLDAEYVIQARLFRTNLGAMRGLEDEHQFEVTVDGARVHLVSLGGGDDYLAALKNPTVAGDEIDNRLTARVKLTAGPHVIGVAWLQKTAPRPWKLKPFVRSSADTLDMTGWPHVDRFWVSGPFTATGAGDTPSRRQVLSCRPSTRAQETPCARKILTSLARRAYRGDVTAGDVDRLLEFYDTGRRAHDFEAGIRFALQRLLASPKFVFRVERDPDTVPVGVPYRLSDLELASRLSFFLWSSIPDDELLDVASAGRLKTPAVLEQQVRRMLANPRANALVTSFAAQWLYLRNLKNQIPNWISFPDFDDNLRQAFQRETELFFASIMHEDRNVLEFITADYTFVNERLARHYGIPNIYGSHFRRVTLADERRRGLLGQGSVLMVTSHSDRTSPVVRGKWILENLLGTPPPAPPANVPPLPEKTGEKTGESRPLSMREKMEEHRANPVCANCHKIMDPIGLSLENFDAVGAWRTHDGGTLGAPISASGELMDGTKIDGIVTLRQALVRQPEIFVGTLTEKLMTYALGRGLASYDMPIVRAIVRDAARQNYRFSSIIVGIATSTPFQMRVKVQETVNAGVAVGRAGETLNAGR
jgi:Protein of unknown function (DUF1592)/Protein of unknown function (DUF1588)/Protein of unknown function (DUF1587)/Protein of unknown function (DUF1585)/Protein of unknown function (DUF1595)/Planctomycete cytochrome C